MNDQDVRKNISAEDFLDFDKVRDSIIFKVIGAKGNESSLSEMPHRVENDMAIVYQIKLGKTEYGVTAVQITNAMMEQLGVEEQTIHNLALANTQREFPATFRLLEDVIKDIIRTEFMGIDLNALSEEDDMKDFLESLLEEQMQEMREGDFPLFILTNDCRINGAATLFYPGIKEQIAEWLGGDYFVLPSSIHECLILPDQGIMNYRELKDMVNEVNQTQVPPEEVLTGEVYTYDKESKQLMFASEKEKRSQTAEKAGDKKMSIMDTLKAKKEEVVQRKPETKVKSLEMEL